MMMTLLSVVLMSCQKTPDAQFTASKTAALVGEEISFTNTTINGSTYLWDFGDALTSTDQNPKHTYAKIGTFTVKLIAYSKNGKKTGEKTLDITITKANEFTYATIKYPFTKGYISNPTTDPYAFFVYLFPSTMSMNSTNVTAEGTGSLVLLAFYSASLTELTAGTYTITNSNDTKALGIAALNYGAANETEYLSKTGTIIVTKDGSNYSFDFDLNVASENDPNAATTKLTGYYKGTLTPFTMIEPTKKSIFSFKLN